MRSTSSDLKGSLADIFSREEDHMRVVSREEDHMRVVRQG